MTVRKFSIAARAIVSTLTLAGIMQCRLSAQELHVGVTVSAGAEVVTNPYIDEATSHSTGAATVQVTPAIWYTGETTQFRLDGYARARKFFSRYGLEDNYGINSEVTHKIGSQDLITATAGVDFTKGRLGQIGNLQNFGAGLTQLPQPSFGNLPVQDITLLGLRGRSTSYHGSITEKHRFDERHTIEISARFQGAAFNTPLARNYTYYDLSSQYTASLDSRTTVGVAAEYRNFNYHGTAIGDGRVFNIAGIFSRKLDDRWTLQANAGVAFTRLNGIVPSAEVRTTSFAFNGSLCNKGARQTACLGYSRQPQPTALGGLRTTDSITFDLNRQVSQRDTVALSVGYSRSNQNAVGAVILPRIEFATASARVDHTINERVSAYANAFFGHTYRSDLALRSSFAAGVGITVKLGQLR